MAESDIKRRKSPGLAAVLSIIPGLGSLYSGNILKGLAHMIVFSVLIVLTEQSYGSDQIILGIFIFAFYIYQIIDSFNDALGKNSRSPSQEKNESEEISLFWSLVVLTLGILFQMANFDLFSYRQILKFWPLLLIAFGMKVVFGYFHKEKRDGP